MKRLFSALLAASLAPSLALAVPQASHPAVLPMSMGGTGSNIGDVSALLSTATGGSAARRLGDRAAEVFNVKDFGAKGDGSTDDTAALNAALTAMAGSSLGGVLELPDGDYILSSSVAVTLGARQRLAIRGGGVHGVRLHWTNSASAGISITLAAVSGAYWTTSGPSLSIENLTGVTDWSTTTANNFISVTSQPNGTGTYQRSPSPVVSIRNVSAASSVDSGGFAGLVSLQNVMVSQLDNLYLTASSSDATATALTLASVSSVTATGLMINRIRQQNGGTALKITDYLQGVYVDNMQTVGTRHSISWTNPGGYTGADSLTVVNGQLNSTLGEIDTSAVSTIILANNYFLGTVAGWYGAHITGGISHAIHGNTFKTTVAGGDATATGVAFSGATQSTVSGNNFVGFTGTTAAGATVKLLSNSTNIMISSNTTSAAAMVYDDQTGGSGIGFGVGNACSANLVGVQFVASGCYTGADQTLNLSHFRWGGNANAVDPSDWGIIVAGQANSLGASVSSSSVIGFNNSITPNYGSVSSSSVFGNSNSAQASNAMVTGKLAMSAYPGSFVNGNAANGKQGGAEQIFWTWQGKSTSTTTFRATADGTASYGAQNVFGLNVFNGGTGIVTAQMEIVITATDSTTLASSGQYHVRGFLTWSGSSATWTQETPGVTGGVSTSNIAISADSSTGGLNIQITPPSADAIVWTTAFRAVVAVPY